jgi:hypothetical protein
VHLAWAILILLTVPVIVIGIRDPAGRPARGLVAVVRR